MRFHGALRECDGLAGAHQEAIRLARRVIMEADKPDLHCWIIVADQFNQVALTVSFSEAFIRSGGGKNHSGPATTS
jgi:hypothetical protein